MYNAGALPLIARQGYAVAGYSLNGDAGAMQALLGNQVETMVDALGSALPLHQSGQARILAIFEPRSNTMKLGTMKSQLPWSLEEADLAFCHSGGLGWDAVSALTPMGERAQPDVLAVQTRPAAWDP